MKSLLTESPATVPATIIGRLGGMIGPHIDDAAVTAHEKSASYPVFFMAGMRIAPMLAVSAAAVPDIPAKKTLAAMLASESPPRTLPTSAFENEIIRSVMPPTFMRLPARMKPGTQRITNESMPLNIRCGMMLSGISAMMR